LPKLDRSSPSRKMRERQRNASIQPLAVGLTGDKASLSHAGQSFERIGRTKNREP